VLKHGVDREGRGICAPMPVGPKVLYGGLSDRDAEDIAHYLLSLPPQDKAVPNDCFAPPPRESARATR
jgi:cytochrome c